MANHLRQKDVQSVVNGGCRASHIVLQFAINPLPSQAAGRNVLESPATSAFVSNVNKAVLLS